MMIIFTVKFIINDSISQRWYRTIMTTKSWFASYMQEQKVSDKFLGSISVSGQLPTYPSPNSTTVNWWQLKVNVGLGEG